MKKFLADLKFRSAGPGHSLVAEKKPTPPASEANKASQPTRKEQTPAQKAAAQVRE